ERPAFLFGNTAPDVQTFSKRARQETHFFDIPLDRKAPAPWLQLLQVHAELSAPDRMPAARAAFLIGYLCHLQADWLWVKDIFLPVFGKRASWENFSRRLYLHNVLRSYLDQEIVSSVANGTATSLAQAHPDHWLPFVRDPFLYRWRDFISDQLQPGAKVRTVEVFAERQGVSPEDYYRLLTSAERMELEVFSHLPLETLERYRESLIEENLLLIQSYFAR
ncbi:MAG: zinc dependent phospholipase C family protein, partial [Anaerolineales bacterium]